MTASEQRALKRKLDKAIAALVNQQRALERLRDGTMHTRESELTSAFKALGDALLELMRKETK